MELIIDNKKVKIEGEKNILELTRKAGIELPTFCYKPDLAVYGSCRMCMVDCEGRGLVPACSTPPADGMVIKTNTEEIREMRQIIIELLLANHSWSCYTCQKSNHCNLQKYAQNMGIETIRFKRKQKDMPKDTSSPSLVRDPNKCILCGNCVRVCAQVQGISAIDFAYRSSNSMILPAFGKGLGYGECVNCGQCAQVCPTGALVPKSEIDKVWKDLNNPELTVIAQIAPAVRVSIGEDFGMETGTNCTGKMCTALKTMGFDHVYDTSYTADLTIMEEATEFLERVTKKGVLPLFTSCCPGWVSFFEEYYPDMLQNLSSCKSPQQMFGAVAKEYGSKTLNIKKENLRVVSIMPCTAKKAEAKRPEFLRDGMPDVDYVLTTQELAQMIKESGQNLKNLEDTDFDLPFGYKTGAGVIFGNSGGVTEAVLRFVTDLDPKTKVGEKNFEFKQVRGMEGIREASITLNGDTFHIAIVSGLANARKVVESIRNGSSKYHFVEFMACPGGCIAGGGQPVSAEFYPSNMKMKRAKGLYDDDKGSKFHKSQENPYIKTLYTEFLKNPGSHESHEYLHTKYADKNLKKKYGVEGK